MKYCCSYVKCIPKINNKVNQASVCTCESLSPSLLASFFLSGLLMYFCFWKVLSSAFLWRSENTARRSMPLLGFPLGARGHENVPGTGTTEEEAGWTKHNMCSLKRFNLLQVSHCFHDTVCPHLVFSNFIV